MRRSNFGRATIRRRERDRDHTKKAPLNLRDSFSNDSLRYKAAAEAAEKADDEDERLAPARAA